MSYSVVIPVYNHESYVREAIQSVLNQTLKAAKIIIIDDGSTDGSKQICTELASQFSEITFLSQSNRGADNAINTGLKMVSTEYVAILNSDDAYANNRFEELFKHAPSTWDLIGSDIRFIDSFSRELPKSHWLTRAKIAQRIFGDNVYSLAYANYFVSTSNFLFRKDLLNRVGFFDNYRYCHDLDFLIRVSQHHKLKFVRRKLLNYRFHSHNTVRESSEKVLSEAWKVIAKSRRTGNKRTYMSDLTLSTIAFLNGQRAYFVREYKSSI